MNLNLKNDNFPSSECQLDKIHVLGRKDKTNGGLLNIGRYYALDSSLGSNVYVDVLHPHIVLICGKRGYGKSYTMGVFIEEIAKLDKKTKENLGVVVIDTLGIFWTSSFANEQELDKLKKWNLKEQGIKINLLVPKNFVKEYHKKGIDVQKFSLRASELSPIHWCQLFNVNPIDPLGIVITRSVLELKKTSKDFSVDDILSFINNDKRCDAIVKGAAENYFAMVNSWGVFDRDGMEIRDIVKNGEITVLDISFLSDQILKVVVTSIIGKKIFDERVKSRKIHELKKMGKCIDEDEMPMTWMAIDEAQLFIPNDKNVLSKDVLVGEWMRQGRQPGLSLLLATQRPSALESEVMSHSDLIICHRLTAQEDIDALSRIRPNYMCGSIKDSIKKIGDERGVAFVIDDSSESTHVIKIRPRCSWHGGAEALALDHNFE